MIKLITGDCIEKMRGLHAYGTFDACVTSPPYNIGLKYGKCRDNLSTREYLSWLRDWGFEVYKLLKWDGSFFLNIAGTLKSPTLPFQVVEVITRINATSADPFVLQNTFHWIKAISIGQDSKGHFKPVNSDRFVTNCHEYVFQFTKSGAAKLDRLAVGVPYADKSNVKRWSHTGGRDRRCKGNVWFIPYDTIQKSRGHPSPFPVALAEHCIKISGAKRVIDPFVGGGSSALAAKRCGVERFVGIDIDSQYIKQARHAVK